MSFVQSKVVPETLPVNAILPLASELHFTRFAIELTVGFGFTVMVNVFAEPVQVLTEGVTVIVAITGAVPAFIAVNDGMVLVPEAAIPILVVLDEQYKLCLK